MKGVLSIDFGASSGRAILYNIIDNKLVSKEIRRFNNDIVYANKTYYWDILYLYNQILESLKDAKGLYQSVAIDTWGVDFALLDKDNNLLENPISYRDSRHKDMVKTFSKTNDLYDSYEISGCLVDDYVTSFQLLSLYLKRNNILSKVKNILLIPDYFAYLLTNNKTSEVSIASTTNLLDVKTKKWSKTLLKTFNLKSNIFPKVVKSGTIVGKISDDLCSYLNIDSVDVIKVCSHDTQSATVSLPTKEKNPLFLCTGTWALAGVILDKANTSKEIYDLNLTNEVTYDNKISLIKNLNGLYHLQELKKDFKLKGKSYSYDDMEKLASKENSKYTFDCSDPIFHSLGNYIEKVYLKLKEQDITNTLSDSQLIRCVYDSLCLSIANSITQIVKVLKLDNKKLYIVGGGVKDKLFCKLISYYSNLEVVTGVSEATSMGNALIQLISNKRVKNICEARNLVLQSNDIKIYFPNQIQGDKNE